ncbi:beta-phosphoglucomutase [Emticicia oligotrophica DSM 17448]|uniref:Beta-phosphoglucomutase n=1 Tax=Emticicia oligotrophica (strain DSM 17448 / CIP 109782 / MTCC 6937 / GPTSA100-15) TaxID=929562 RepID=A0ABN4ARJ9_EMTOG|nr:beta-phosphoglucomutase [Emticicia oligotrophica]AFK05164.1 beta-phosphoglucomutase [Emticicia oligotrophica DSM 17448]
MIKGFLFDLDGVIVETAIFHYQAWRKMANDLGFDISEEFNESLKGVSRMDSLNLILQHGNVMLSEEEKLILAAKKNEHYLTLVSQMTSDDILPGVKDFFEQIKKTDIKIALGSVSKNAKMILEGVGLINDFDAIIDGTKISNGKPDPEVFLKGAEELGLQANECLVFEDAVAGVEAGKRAGMKVIGIGHENVLTQADLVLKSFENINLSDLLSKIL